MRDINRIPIVLEKIKEFWEKNPDLRLGQLLCNMSKTGDPFSMEDEYLIEQLERWDTYGINEKVSNTYVPTDSDINKAINGR